MTALQLSKLGNFQTALLGRRRPALTPGSAGPAQRLPLPGLGDAREGVELSLSTLADLVGHATVALEPLHALIAQHVRAADRLHGDDTTVPLLARGGTLTARLWTYVRDDRPFAGGAPPAALFFFSRDREKTHPNRHLGGWQGILQADAYGGYNDLYRTDRAPGPVTSALCWSHARRKFFELADIAGNVRKGKPPTRSPRSRWRPSSASTRSSTSSAAWAA